MRYQAKHSTREGLFDSLTFKVRQREEDEWGDRDDREDRNVKDVR